MKCKECGTIFMDGIFCPECGAKQIANIYNENTDRKEKQDLERKKAEVELLKQENIKKNLESQSVQGVVYRSYEEAMVAKEEHMKFDLLKTKLLGIKSQQKRQMILSEYTEIFVTPEVKQRYELLKMKVEMPVPKSEKICRVIGFLALISFVMIFVLSTVWPMDVMPPVAIAIACLFSGCLWTWIIWKIVMMFQRMSKKHYKNIKHI